MKASRRVPFLGIAAVVGVTLLSSTPAIGRPSLPTRAQAGPSVHLVDQSAWVRDGGELQIRFRVTGTPDDATVRLVIYEKVRSREAFADTLSGDLGDDGPSMPNQPLSGLPRVDDFGNLEVRYPIGDDGAGLDAEDDYGVYPVKLVIADSGGDPLAELVTYLVLLPQPNSEFQPLAVAVLMEIGAPPGLQPDGTTHVGQEELAEIRRRVDLLALAPPIPLTVAPVPETLDALADVSPPQDALLASFREAVVGKEVLARPYVDLDLGALAAANMLGHVRPEADAGVQAAQFLLRATPQGDTWLTGPTASQATAVALRDLGVPRAIVPSGVVSVPDEPDGTVPTTPVSLAEGGPIAFVADDGLSERLQGQEGRLDAQRFIAELATIWSLAPARARGVVVHIPDQSSLDPAVVSASFAGLADGQALRPVTVGELFAALAPAGDDEPVQVELTSNGEPSHDLSALPPSMDAADRIVGGLAGMLDDGGLIRSLNRSLLIASGAETPDDQRMAYVNRAHDAERSLVGAINAPGSFRITLTAREGTIPLTIDNTSEQEVMARVHLTSSQLEFPDGENIDVAVPPGGTRVDVQVRTRASGAFPLGIRITSPDGSIVLDRTTFTIRSTAISGVGLVLSIGAGLFLLIWWARHWRTARRSSRLIAQHAPGTRRQRASAHSER